VYFAILLLTNAVNNNLNYTTTNNEVIINLKIVFLTLHEFTITQPNKHIYFQLLTKHDTVQQAIFYRKRS